MFEIPMAKVSLNPNLPMSNMGRVRLEYHRSLFWAIGRPQKAEIGYVSEVGHGKGNGQGGDDTCRARGGQGRLVVPQVPLQIHGEGPEG